MKHFYFFLILILTAFSATAQQYVPFPKSGAIWEESYTEHDWGYVYHIKQENDTSINGINYILLSTVERHAKRDQFGNLIFYFSKGLFGGMREDSNKRVFYYDLKEEKEHLLYDFNMQVGDTVPAYIGGRKVVAIDSVLIDTSYRKRYAVGNHRIDAYILEGIGSTQGLKNKITLQFEIFYSLNCFSVNGTSISVNRTSIYPGSYKSCEIIVSVDETEKKDARFNIFPNPSTGIFSIQTQSIFSESYICVRDVLGRTVLQEKIQSPSQTFDISNQAKGLYFVEVRSGNRKSVQKLILQ